MKNFLLGLIFFLSMGIVSASAWDLEPVKRDTLPATESNPRKVQQGRFTKNVLAYSKGLSLQTISGFKQRSQKSFLQLNEDLFYEDTHLEMTTIYPNPAPAQAFFDYRLEKSIEAKVTISNLLGTVLKEYTLSMGSHKTTIQTSNFDPGVYFYTLTINGKAKKSHKLIVRGF